MIPTSQLIIAACLISLGIFIWRARPSKPMHRRFALFTIFIAGWSVAIGGIHTGHHVVWWSRAAFAAASLIPPAFLAFSHRYPTLGCWPPTGTVRLVYGIGIVFAALSATTPLIVLDGILTPSGLFRVSGALYPAFALYFVSAWSLALAMFCVRFRVARGFERMHLQYLGAAIIIPLAGAVATNLLIPLFFRNSTYSWIGPYFGLLLALLVAHAIIRHRLLDLRLVIHRGLTLAIAALLSFVPVATLLVLVWPRLVAHLEATEILVVLGAVAAVTLLVPITRDVSGRLLDRYVYRRRANYQRTVRSASAMLTRVLDLQVLMPFLRDTVMNTTECDGAAIYVRTERRFRKGAPESRHAGSRFGAPDDLPAAVAATLDRLGDAVMADDLTREPVSSDAQSLHVLLEELNWSLVLPAISENVVVGAIVLGPKRSGDPFYADDLDLLMTLANQAGIAIRNAQLYGQVLLANEHLRNIVATLESGVVAVDAGGDVTMFNPTAAHFTGVRAEDAIGKPLAALPPALAESLAATLRDGIGRTEAEVEVSDGTTTRPVICRTSTLYGLSQSILGAVAVLSDLTPVKALEVERRRAERLAYLEALAAAIAHEVKQPLVAVKTFGQLLPRRRHDERFAADFSRVIEREVERMERLIARLKMLSGPGARALETLDVRQPIADALEFLQPSFEAKGLALRVDLGDVVAPVVGDPGELEALFLNLLVNAHQATPPDGEVRVRVMREETHVTIEVADSGPGIPAHVIEHIFEPFVTTKQRGSGLGLAICAAIAARHQARVRAANESEGGARFTVEVPLATAGVSAG